jgi:NADPH:quinone reductase-like Zn-dependent oxidoreductase
MMSDMKAMIVRRFGGPDVLQLETVERPTPGDREVLVRVSATSVNPIDFKTRAGGLRQIVDESKLPIILGRDVSGIVEEVGPGVSDWRVGDAIFARPGLDRGCYAEFVILKPDEIAPAPKNISLADAGAIPLAAMTAWQGLMKHGKLESGQRALIHGGAGGVGHFAVQFAKGIGATVFATCSGRDKAFVEGLGADVAIDYRAQQFERIATDIDLVLDLVGGETQRRSWAVLRSDGLLLSPVQKPDDDLARAAGVQPGRFYRVEASSSDLAEIGRLCESSAVKVVISERYALERVGEAQAALERGGVRGKLLVLVAAETP